ncbi:MAG: hypothetical protein AB9888_13075 [Bacteroidales bacterium]
MSQINDIEIRYIVPIHPEGSHVPFVNCVQTIETFIEYEKDFLGSITNQLIMTLAILSFWILTACLLAFFKEQRACSQDTRGQARQTLQHAHQKNLLSWLQSHFIAGDSIEKFYILLAL